jgi:hypothetical protein
VTTTKKGLKTMRIREIKTDDGQNLSDALKVIGEMMTEFLDIEGFEYTVRIWETISEAMRNIKKAINEIQVDYAPISEIFLLYCLVMMTILGFWMAKQAMKSADNKIQLKGKLLYGGFLLFAFSAALEILIPIIPIIVLARILVIICALLLYGGFVLPKSFEKLFLRKDDT